MDLAASLGKTLLTGKNQPGLAAPVFSYPTPKPIPAPRPVVNSVPDYAGAAQNEYAKLLAQIRSLAAPAPTPVAPYFDIASNFSRARSQAEAAVNPLYTKKLNDFITQQQVDKTRKQQDVATANTQLDEALKTALDASNISRQRTTEDTAANLGQINNTEQNYQTDNGTAFDNARKVLAGNIAQSGLTGSGLGTQQAAGAVTDRNTTESRAVTSFDTQKQAQELAKTRTFEDLLNSDKQNQTKTAQGKSANQINLDRFIQDQATDLSGQKTALEGQRLQDIISQEGQYAKLGFSDFLKTLKNPSQIALASQTYGGLF